MIQDRICKQCNINFKGGPRAYYCPDCRLERNKETNKSYKAKKKKGNVRKLGSTDKCEMCGKDYIVNSGQQKFCPDCKIIHTLEHDRITGLKFYHLNKDKINPIRNIRRRQGSIKCKWCGKEFEPRNKSLTCSDGCARSYRNYLWSIKNKGRIRIDKFRGGDK